MTEEVFQLLGFDEPLNHYPAPVVPVGRLGGRLVAVYAGDDVPEFVTLDDAAEYVRCDDNTLRNLGEFDPFKQRLFALGRKDIKSYVIEDEQRVFLALLKQRFFSIHNPFFRLSLAKVVNRPSILLRELSLCAAQIYRTAPEVLDSWYSGQLNTMRENWSEDVSAILPSNWRELPSIPRFAAGSSGGANVSTDNSGSESHRVDAYGAGAAMARRLVVTGLFKNREGFEFACQSLVKRGYSLNQIHILMSEATLLSAFPELKVEAEDGNKEEEDEQGWWSTDEGFSEQLIETITGGGVFTFPDSRVFISGPLHSLLSGSEDRAVRMPQDLKELLVSEGLPESTARQYQIGITGGSIAVLMSPASKEQGHEISEEWVYDQN